MVISTFQIKDLGKCMKEQRGFDQTLKGMQGWGTLKDTRGEEGGGGGGVKAESH